MSLLIRDPEELLAMVKNFLIADLNGVIDKMNNRKGDTLLSHVNPDDYFFYLRSKPNKNLFVHIFIDEAEVNSNRVDSIQDYDIFIELLLSDDLKDESFIKALRYTQCLKDTIEKNAFVHQSPMEIQTIIPISIGEKGTFPRMWVTCIKLRTSIV